MKRLYYLILIWVSLVNFPSLADPGEDVAEQVENFLDRTSQKYSKGSPAYYAREALAQALLAYREGNYGIGAVVVLVYQGQVYEFRGRNAMVTGLGLMDHAEARALQDALAYREWILRNRPSPDDEKRRRSRIVQPSDIYAVEFNKHTRSLQEGIYVYGTLEPCPMCMSMIINASGTRASVSSFLDGELIEHHDGKVSNGAALAIGDKFNYCPLVWQGIALSKGLTFTLLEGNTADIEELRRLSGDIFLSTRVEIDRALGQR